MYPRGYTPHFQTAEVSSCCCASLERLRELRGQMVEAGDFSGDVHGGFTGRNGGFTIRKMVGLPWETWRVYDGKNC